MLTLEKPTESAFKYLLEVSIKDYAQNLLNCGAAKDRGDAKQKARREITGLIPQSLNTPGQFVYRVKSDNLGAGWLWYEIMDDGQTAFLQYIYIILTNKNM